MVTSLASALIAVAGFTGVARAGTVTPPAGWTADAELSARIARAPAVGQAYRAPGAGAVLYVTRVERKATAADRDAIASGELAELGAALRRQGAGARTEASAQRADPAAKQLEASISWRDTAAGLADASRVVVAADAARVVAVTGQCVLAADAPAALVTACHAALATLEVDLAPATRVPLAIVAAVAEPAAPPAAATEPGPAVGASTGSAASMAPAPANLPAGSAAPLDRAPPPPAAEADRRPIYVGLGLLVLAALFWWNRRRRERFEGEDGSGARDADADDLHAAADKEQPK